MTLKTAYRPLTIVFATLFVFVMVSFSQARVYAHFETDETQSTFVIEPDIEPEAFNEEPVDTSNTAKTVPDVEAKPMDAHDVPAPLTFANGVAQYVSNMIAMF